MVTKAPWEWQEKALCKDIDLSGVPLIDTVIEPDEDKGDQLVIHERIKHPSDIFYVEDWEEEKVERAKGYCAICPVQEQCLDFALGTREREGIWGGTTGNERRSMLNKMRKAGVPIPKYDMPMPRGVSEGG